MTEPSYLNAQVFGSENFDDNFLLYNDCNMHPCEYDGGC